MEEQPSASRKDKLAGKQETKHLWLLLFYGVVLLTILLSHFGLMRDVEGSTVALLLILALPFLLPYLKSIEAFGVKVDIRDEVRELKNEVKDTKESVREEVRAINQRFDSLAQKSQEFLQLKPLNEVWNAINEMKASLSNSPLSNEEIDESLGSTYATKRLPGYIELQLRPNPERLEQVLDCLYLEVFFARRTKFETRPMWQAVHTINCIADAATDLPQHRRESAKFTVQQVLDFLQANQHLDPGCECKRYLSALVERFAR